MSTLGVSVAVLDRVVCHGRGTRETPERIRKRLRARLRELLACGLAVAALACASICTAEATITGDKTRTPRGQAEAPQITRGNDEMTKRNVKDNSIRRKPVAVECDYCGMPHGTAWHDAEIERASEAAEQAWLEGLDAEAEHAAEAVAEEWIYAAANDDAGPIWRPTRQRPADERPVIRLGPDLADVADLTIEALAECAEALGVFQRGHRLVHVTATTEEEAAASRVVSIDPTGVRRRELIAGSPAIHEMEAATLRDILTRVARFERKDGRAKKGTEWRHCIPGDPVVYAVLQRKKWIGIPSLAGVAESPFLRPDGTVCQTPGFDPATAFWYAPSSKFPRVPEHPTPEDARKAYTAVEEVFVDFPFASEAHRAVPIAGSLTIVGRPAIEGPTPGFEIDGNVRGAGKTLVDDAVAMMVSGRCMPHQTFPVQEEEREKVLGCFAMDGTPFFLFDNVNREFGGGCLDAALTSREVKFRILGGSKQPRLPWYAVMFVNGNNMTVCGDISDRLLVARLESPEENPRRRPASTFLHPDLLAWVREQRPPLVVALLTILRAYVVAHRPDMGCERWGSYEDWSRLVPHAIRFAGGPDVMAARIIDETTVNPELGHVAGLVNLWPGLIDAVNASALKRWELSLKNVKEANEKAVKDAKKANEKAKLRAEPPKPAKLSLLTCHDAIEALYDKGATSSSFDPLREAIEGLCCPGKRSGEVRPTTGALSAAMRKYMGRVTGGSRIRNHVDTHTKVAGWWVEPVERPVERVAGVAGVAGGVGLGRSKLSLIKNFKNDTSRGGTAGTPATPAVPASGEAAE